jgi:gamma-glutamyltranspeptidase/glutathione hydrolase
MKAAILASDSVVAEQATDLLKVGAVEAVVAAALVAAARDPSVFFGPLQMLVGGAGRGLHAIDGRVRQPGLGANRPRGFKGGEEIPAAAYVGVPAFAGAVFAALALTGNDATLGVFSPAISAAKAISKPRAEFLNRIARKGAAALAENDIAGELVAAAGRVAGGLLTQEDLAAVRPEVARCRVVEHADEHGTRRIAVAPWANDARAVSEAKIEIILAIDARAQIAAACYQTSSDAVPLAFDLSAPKIAAPVLRGEERLPVGTPLGAAAPIAILSAGSWDAAFGATQAVDVASGALQGDLDAIVAALGAGAIGIQHIESRMRLVRG